MSELVKSGELMRIFEAGVITGQMPILSSKSNNSVKASRVETLCVVWNNNNKITTSDSNVRE